MHASRRIRPNTPKPLPAWVIVVRTAITSLRVNGAARVVVMIFVGLTAVCGGQPAIAVPGFIPLDWNASVGPSQPHPIEYAPIQSRPDTTIPNWFGQKELDARFLPPRVDEYENHGRNVPGVSRHVFRQTNEVRRSRDRLALAPERSLNRIACRHNKDMMAHDYMGHEDSDGRGPGDRVAREHRRAVIKASAENVLWFYNPQSRDAALAEDLVQSWMDSPPHRKNILSSKYTHIGACVTVRNDTVRATQVFAKIGATLDRPLPWSVARGDSLRMGVSPVQPNLELNGYTFQALEGNEEVDHRDVEPLNGMVYLPRTPGLHSFRVWTARKDGNTLYYEGVGGGPYLRVNAR